MVKGARVRLWDGPEEGGFIAYKGAFLQEQSAEGAIPPKSNRRDPLEYDRDQR